MDSPFQTARVLASSLKYQGEASREASVSPTLSIEHVWTQFSNTGMELLPETVPAVHNVIKRCCERLMAPTDGIRAFVYASEEYQAACLPVDEDNCAIRLSSTIIESLDETELTFVVGHEMGHFLLNHWSVPADRHDLEHYAALRAREVSCDRIGLLACGDVDAAIRGTMKTVSGLSERHLRFDSAAYISAALTPRKAAVDPSSAFATHPVMPLRARCLLWFSDHIKRFYPDLDSKDATASFRKLDAKVHKDMLRYSEAPKEAFLSSLEGEASQWIYLGAAVSDGKLTKSEQAALANKFGDDFVLKARRNFDGSSTHEITNLVCARALENAKAYLEAAPIRARATIVDLLTASEREFLDDKCPNIVRADIEGLF